VRENKMSKTAPNRAELCRLNKFLHNRITELAADDPRIVLEVINFFSRNPELITRVFGPNTTYILTSMDYWNDYYDGKKLIDGEKNE